MRDDAKKVIQAKLRRHMTVGNDAVQQVIAAKGVYNCPGAVVITNSTFTPEAEELARILGVELVDGKLLRLRLQQVLGESWGYAVLARGGGGWRGGCCLKASFRAAMLAALSLLTIIFSVA